MLRIQSLNLSSSKDLWILFSGCIQADQPSVSTGSCRAFFLSAGKKSRTKADVFTAENNERFWLTGWGAELNQVVDMKLILVDVSPWLFSPALELDVFSCLFFPQLGTNYRVPGCWSGLSDPAARLHHLQSRRQRWTWTPLAAKLYPGNASGAYKCQLFSSS